MTNQLPTRPTEREKVYDVLDGERGYQNATRPASPNDLVHFTNLLIEYTDKLAVDVVVDPSGASPAGGPLKRLREIAAIAVQAMEVHGAQPRANHVPASAGITGTAHIVAKADNTKPAPPTLAAKPVAHPLPGTQGIPVHPETHSITPVVSPVAEHHQAAPVAGHTTQHPGEAEHKK